MNTKITHFLRFGEKGGGLKEALFWGSFTQGTFLSYSLFFFFSKFCRLFLDLFDISSEHVSIVFYFRFPEMGLMFCCWVLHFILSGVMGRRGEACICCYWFCFLGLICGLNGLFFCFVVMQYLKCLLM